MSSLEEVKDRTEPCLKVIDFLSETEEKDKQQGRRGGRRGTEQVRKRVFQFK